jgi:CRP-like cAMP-binding protein
MSHDRRYHAGDLIFSEGDSKTEMLVVLRGSVTIGQQTGAGEKSYVSTWKSDW